MHTIDIHRRITAGAVATIVCALLAACGAEVSPPAQDISRDLAQEQDRSAPASGRRTGNRVDFGDEYGTAEVRDRKASPAGSGTSNRLDFRDDGR